MHPMSGDGREQVPGAPELGSTSAFRPASAVGGFAGGTPTTLASVLPTSSAPSAATGSELRALRMRRNALGLWLLKKFCSRSCAPYRQQSCSHNIR